jgi:hypothetical protein
MSKQQKEVSAESVSLVAIPLRQKTVLFNSTNITKTINN